MKTKLKMSQIPPADSVLRKLILKHYLADPAYVEDIRKGLPFFTEEELKAIEERYEDKGMTRKDLMAEIHKKGWLIPENTIKHYMQIKQLPLSLRREKTSQGMISRYPHNIIRHLNFIRYCLYAGTVFLTDKEALADRLKKALSINDKIRLEFASMEVGGGLSGNDCLHELQIGLRRIEDGIAWSEESIEKAFSSDELKKATYLSHLREIEKLFNDLERKISEFDKVFENNSTPADDNRLLDFLDGKLTPVEDEVGGES